jgi:hypothetical protein
LFFMEMLNGPGLPCSRAQRFWASTDWRFV